MKKIVDYLIQLGFSETEAKIYWYLLETGPMTVAELAQVIKINRTAAYPYINSLLAQGIIAEIIQHSRKQLVAIDPEQLHYILERKLNTIKTLQAKFPNIIETINIVLPQRKKTNESEVMYYKGLHNVKKIYQEALCATELRTYAKVEEKPVEKLFPDNVKLFNDAFKKNKKIKVWEIIYNSTFGEKNAQDIFIKNNRYAYKIMSSNMNLKSEDILIYDGKVAILNYKEKKTGIILTNNDYYDDSKELFDYIWNTLPEVNR